MFLAHFGILVSRLVGFFLVISLSNIRHLVMKNIFTHMGGLTSQVFMIHTGHMLAMWTK